jgi:replicative DNA helicase
MKKRYKQESNVDISGMVYGKMPPQAIEPEQAILGALMLEKSAIDEVGELLTAESFYKPAHQLIFQAIEMLNSKGNAIDIVTVVEELRSMGKLEEVGGPYYVTQLTNSVVSSANIEKHARIVKQKQLGRELINIGGELVIKGYDDTQDVFELLEDHERKLSAITMGSMGKAYTPIDVALMGAIQQIEAMRERKEVMTGIPSMFTELDRLTNGWQKTDLIILAARPAVGKTAFALNLARNAAINNILAVPVLFFSLEMSCNQLVQRILSAESEIWLEKILRGDMDTPDMKQLYQKGITSLSKARIFIDDSGYQTLSTVRSKARKVKRMWEKTYGTNDGLIIIDYLQLMSATGKGGNREQEISEISRGLKMLAKELEVPIIALSQLSRAVESRSGDKKIPQLSDLRESGAIEQDADMVMFIYRPEYHDINANENGESIAGETHIKIAKHRHGSLDTVKLKANLSIQKFTSWDYEQFGQPISKGAEGRDLWVPFAKEDTDLI